MKCNNCGKQMVEIGSIGRSKKLMDLGEDGKFRFIGEQEIVLYQCNYCKTIILN